MGQKMNEVSQLRKVEFTDPAEFETAIVPVADGARIRPLRKSRLEGEVKVASLQRIGFLAIDSGPLMAQINPAHGFYGLTLTLSAPFETREERSVRTFQRNDAHLLFPEREFDFRAQQRAHVLGTNFFVENLEDHARLLEGGADAVRLTEDCTVSLASQAGSSLARYLAFVWGELNRGGGILNSRMAAKEIEDGLIAALIWALEETPPDIVRDVPDRRVKRAEEYLMAHLCESVTRADLAAHCGMSIRTLSRAFVKCHGMGPIEYLKQRRLEAARMELLMAEPGDATVVDVALRYGYSQPSRFTTAYKAVFHELPSETLCAK